MGTEWAFADLAQRARTLAARPGRSILGITGPPAAGKSTLAERLVTELGPDAAYVPLDGFHLAHRALEEIGLVDRKGAPETFDAAGYVALLQRLAEPDAEVIYAPRFHREIEDSIANEIPVRSHVSLVVTEGNYLLVPSAPWHQVAGLLSEIWYLDLDEELRMQRLIERHRSFGRTEAQAQVRASGSDQRNAELVITTRNRASVIIPAAGRRCRDGYGPAGAFPSSPAENLG